MRWTRLLGVATPDVARGIRAAFVTLAPFYLATRLGLPALGWTALAGWLGTLADPGGPRSTRAKALIAFAVAGAPLVFGLEELARFAGPSTAALMAVAFGMSLLRAVGGSAGTLGTFLTMTAAIAGARVRADPVGDAVGFAAGATLALFVSSIAWPVWTHLPVRRAVAAVYAALADYLDDAERAVAGGPAVSAAVWTELARRHHRRIRGAIENARSTALDGRARRQGETRFGGSIRALLGAAEVQFPVISSLVVELEAGHTSSIETHRIEALAATQRAVATALDAPDLRPYAARLRAVIPPASPPAVSIADHLVDRLERAGSLVRDLVYGLAAGTDDSASSPPTTTSFPPSTPPMRSASASGPPPQRAPRASRVTSAVLALRDAWSWRSPFLIHAARTALAAGAASLVGELLSRSRVYWVTLTTLAILQPYPGATVKRAGERVVGTVLGCVVALFITTTIHSRLALSLLLVPLSVAAVATRPRSYRLFTLFLTPVFVLLTDPAHDWRTSAQRAGDAVLGGAIALAAGVLIAPASERKLAPDALRDMLTVLGSYASVVFAALLQPAGASGRTTARADQVASARRAVGIALGAAEASLERWLAEPLSDRAFAADAMLLVTYARRLATALTSLDVLRAFAPGGGPDASRVAAYVADVLEAARAHVLGSAVPALPPAPVLYAPADVSVERAFERIVRWAALVASVAHPPDAPDP
jgi:uncharacterized membrane protein YccC